ncbi:NAD(P)H-quinone dehydrogenase [Nakamurella sp. PAMC28650]|jgi:pyruvate/2-oxoglutarate dehydrogenase complex dihydrolipoamide dehydrogenase (E3) component|uniref:NAD(P)H-quinone dehydrogenase n=1 Tax=Nakamurella sp. PAMC28650 TaxID=2762325 RepID=UPI00164DCCEB|nr:NAD(P)H-quinone dehydrogenase [Nakamurella sp. PAMC28650]QNK83134.1 NAD(P)H-quinone dehydrogenase [Nakamurella sp. PAMC28650]
MTRIVIMGGGPAGYEAALVAAQYGAEVTLVETDGPGGGCVLYDCVPSKTFIASAGARTSVRDADELGVIVPPQKVEVDVDVVHGRVKSLALAQSADIGSKLLSEGVTVLAGRAELADSAPGLAAHRVEVIGNDGTAAALEADVVLIATGASPRLLESALPDGERILTWRQLYSLPAFPDHLIVIGSGVTGAEFASAYNEIGVKVTLVSSRDRVLPSEDADAAAVIEEVFTAHGGVLARRARAESVVNDGEQVIVTLTDGRQVRGSHALMTVGSVPNTYGIGLDKVGIELPASGFIPVDRVSRTSVAGIYAAGDCTGVLMLASVAAMQGRIAMWHALGEGVPSLRLRTVAANVFTHPEIATVGISQAEVDAGKVPARTLMMPLSTNPRAKMTGMKNGFIKLVIRPATGIVIGGVVVAPSASELILPIALAVQNGLTAKDLAYTLSVYPSLSGSITEIGRRLMHYDGDLG